MIPSDIVDHKQLSASTRSYDMKSMSIYVPLSYTVAKRKERIQFVFVTLGFCVRVNDSLYAHR